MGINDQIDNGRRKQWARRPREELFLEGTGVENENEKYIPW